MSTIWNSLIGGEKRKMSYFTWIPYALNDSIFAGMNLLT